MEILTRKGEDADKGDAGREDAACEDAGKGDRELDVDKGDAFKASDLQYLVEVPQSDHNSSHSPMQSLVQQSPLPKH